MCVAFCVCVGCFFLSRSPHFTALVLCACVKIRLEILQSDESKEVTRSEKNSCLLLVNQQRHDDRTERRKLIVHYSAVSFDVIFVDLTFRTVRRDYSARRTRLRMDLIYAFSLLDRRMRTEMIVSLSDHITRIRL